MSSEASSVGSATREPHGYPTAHSPHQHHDNYTTTPTHTAPANKNMTTLTPKSPANTNMATTTPTTALYMTTMLPALAPGAIRILFNNTNALSTENVALLAAKLTSYLKHKPTILGLMEVKLNFHLYDETTKPQ
jgi:hypothetical protein